MSLALPDAKSLLSQPLGQLPLEFQGFLVTLVGSAAQAWKKSFSEFLNVSS